MTDSYKSTLPDDVLLTLGQIAAEMSGLEHTFQYLLWHVIDPSDTKKGLSITGPLQLNQKVDLLLALANLQSNEPFKSDLIAVGKQVDWVRPERNRKLHAVYELIGNDLMAITLAADRRSLKESSVNLSELRESRDEIVNANERVMRCFLKWFGERPAWPDKSE